MEFVHYHNGTRSDPQNMAYRDIAKSQAHDVRGEKLAPGMYHSDERAPERWNASVKVRHHESVHMPEYKGWHNHGRNPFDLNAAWKWQPAPGNGLPIKPVTRVSRGPNFRVSENAGFSWDPAAAYGPETVKALPKVDDKVREALFDETADQRFDGQPNSGIMHFGSKTHT